jgi:leader peptidase (prepilin peptidase) / N-methyltransferase
VLLWALLGAGLGSAQHRGAQRLLALPTQSPALVAAVPLACATAVLFGLLAWRIELVPDLLAYSGLAVVCVPLAAIDLLERRLPTRLLLPAYPSLGILLGFAALVEGNTAAMLRSLAGMAILFVCYLLIALATHDGLGAADVRLAGLLGLALGWQGWNTLLLGAVLGLLYAGLTGAMMIAARRACWHSLIPLGPALIAGAFTALLLPLG